MNIELEKIVCPYIYYNLFITNLVYRTPHLHQEYELCLLLDGRVTVRIEDKAAIMETGDFWLVNPFECHELTAREPAQILCLQFTPHFFSGHFPQIRQFHFLASKLRPGDQKYDLLRTWFVSLGQNTFAKEAAYELRCASLLNYIFFLILDAFPRYTVSSAQSHCHQSFKTERSQIIEQYIEKHYQQKLLLSDISKHLGLSLSYLSHFFKDKFGMSFQNYLAKFRCEKARILLLSTSLSLLDISLSCGFSDPKYFNKHFRQQFGCTPMQYKKYFQHTSLSMQQKAMLTTQNILSSPTSLMILDKYVEKESIIIPCV